MPKSLLDYTYETIKWSNQYSLPNKDHNILGEDKDGLIDLVGKLDKLSPESKNYVISTMKLPTLEIDQLLKTSETIRILGVGTGFYSETSQKVEMIVDWDKYSSGFGGFYNIGVNCQAEFH